MKKINKKQMEAVISLECMIDELDNKPRRLFSSLRQFANAFLQDKEHLKQVIVSIDEFEEYYYLFLNIPDMTASVVKSGIKAKKELLTAYSGTEEEKYTYESGIDDCKKVMTKKIIEELLELN